MIGGNTIRDRLVGLVWDPVHAGGGVAGDPNGCRDLLKGGVPIGVVVAELARFPKPLGLGRTVFVAMGFFAKTRCQWVLVCSAACCGVAVVLVFGL